MLFFSIITGSEFLQVLLGQLLYPLCLAQTRGQSLYTALANSFLRLHHIPSPCFPCSWRYLSFLWIFPVLTTVLTKVSGCQKHSSFSVPSCLKSSLFTVHCSSSISVISLVCSDIWTSVVCWVCAGDCYAQPLHLQPQECERPSEKCQRQECVWKFLKAWIEKVLFSPRRSSNTKILTIVMLNFKKRNNIKRESTY